MPSRRRKKPPDLPFASLLSFFCCNHGLSPDLVYPSRCNLSQSFDLGACGRTGAVSCQFPSRSRTVVYTRFRSCSTPVIWASTNSAAGYRYGKFFGRDYPASTSSEVWSFYSLSSSVARFPDVALIFLWRRACLCPSVSIHFRLLVFRSEFQVCFLPLYPPPLLVICCLRFYLMDSNLKSTMHQFVSRLFSSIGFLFFRWMLIKQVQSLDKICRVLGPLCDVLPVVISMATLLILNPINGCFDLNLDLDGFASCRGYWKGLFGFYNRVLNAYSPGSGNVFIFVHSDILESVSSFGPLWHFVLLMLTCSCIIWSLVAGLGRDQGYQLSDTRLGSLDLVFCNVHLGYLIRLYLSLAADFPRRPKTISYLLRLVHELSDILVIWVLPSLLFSQRRLAVFHLLYLKPSLLSLLLSSLALFLIWFWFYVAMALDSGLQLPQWEAHVYLGLFLDVCSSCATCQVQHGFRCSMCRSYIGLVGHTPRGSWFLLVMMTLYSSLAAMWVKLRLSWGLPSLWLSLFMVSPYAHMLGTLCSCICWHLASLLKDWDEVKGQSPLVYEEVFSVTSVFDVKLFTVITFRLIWFSVAGFRTTHCSHDQWPERSREPYGRVFPTCGRLMVKDPLWLLFLSGMFCFHMDVLEQLKCVNDVTVLLPYKCTSSLAVSCTRDFVSEFEQHLRVLGPCLVALDMHLRMLGKVSPGPYCKNVLRIITWMSTYVMVLQVFCSWCFWFAIHLIFVTGPCQKALARQHWLPGSVTTGMGVMWWFVAYPVNCRDQMTHMHLREWNNAIVVPCGVEFVELFLCLTAPFGPSRCSNLCMLVRTSLFDSTLSYFGK